MIDRKDKIAQLRMMAKTAGSGLPDGFADALCGLLSEMDEEIERLRQGKKETDSYLECIDKDLSALEDAVFAEDEDGETDECTHDCASCGMAGECGFTDNDADTISYTCPHCGAELTFDIDAFDLDGELTCPDCGGELIIEIEDDSADEDN